MLSNCTLKIALGIFYLRVAMKTWHIWSIRLLMSGTVLFGTVYFFLVMFQCIPGPSFPPYRHTASLTQSSIRVLEKPPRVK